MKREETLKHLENLYDARLSNCVENIVPLFADTGVFRISCEEPGLLFPPPVSTAEGRKEVLEVLIASWEWLELKDWLPIVDGRNAAARYVLRARHVPSGEELSCEMCDQITFDESGKVTEFVEFVDTGHVEKLAQKLS